MRRWLIPMLLGVPTVALVVAVLVRGPSARTGGSPRALPITVADPDYRRLQEEWLAKRYVVLMADDEEEVLPKVAQLPVHVLPESLALSRKQAGALAQVVTSSLGAFLAGNFTEYLARFPAGKDAVYDPEFVRGFGEMIGMDRPGTSAQSVAEAWWQTNMLSGAWAKDVWLGVCWEDSALLATEVTKPEELEPGHHVKYLQEAIQNCGIVSTSSIFVHSPDARELLVGNGNLMIGSASILSMFTSQDQTTAFPLILSFFWDPNEEMWFPHSLAWGYAGPVPPLPVF